MPLALEVTESVECEHYRRDRIVYDTETAMSVPAYLLVPHEREGAPPGPAVLAIHGHGEGKSMVCDIDDGDADKRAEITGYNGAYGHELARRGFVVLAPDLRCFGERQDPRWDPSSRRYDCDWNLVCAVMTGTNPLAQNLWDLQRSLDVLCGHPLVDPDRVGVCGLSYGGTMTLFTAAVDERVRAAVVSGYLSSWAAAHRMPVQHVRFAGDVGPARRARARRHRRVDRAACCSRRPAPRISSSRSKRRGQRSRHFATCTRHSTRARGWSTTCSKARTRGTVRVPTTSSPSISERRDECGVGR